MTAPTDAPTRSVGHVIVGDEPTGVVRRLWDGVGYDELNWTATRRGAALLALLGSDVLPGGYSIRMHNTVTSGNGWSAPAWGAGDVFHRQPDGSVLYRWDILDATYDAITSGGGTPLVELGFMPRDLSRVSSRSASFEPGADVGFEDYELGNWKFPPSDDEEWADLVRALVGHFVERYGRESVAGWRFEMWNEPDIPNYWRGSWEEYLQLWDVTYRAFRDVLPEGRIGGPATTAHGSAELERFCRHVVENGNVPDFLSFHTKGAHYDPRRHYNHFVPAERQTPSRALMLEDIRRNLAVIAQYPELADRPVLVDECDPAVGTVYGEFDNPSFAVTNSEYYPSFVARLVHDLQDESFDRVEQITHWAFYMEGKRWFEGNRTLIDNEDVEKPFLNGLRMIEALSGLSRLPVDVQGSAAGDVVALGGRDGEVFRLLLIHHHDDWWAQGCAELTIDVPVSGTARLMRLDAEHGNTYRTWEGLGRPAWPDAAQVDQIRQGGTMHAEPVAGGGDGSGRLTLEIPMHGLALLEVTIEPPS